MQPVFWETWKALSGDHFAFERHRVTFDLSNRQSSVAAVKKHLTEFLGRGGACKEIWHERFRAKAVQIVAYFQRDSEKKTCKEIKDRLARTPTVLFRLRPIVKAFKLVLLLQACLRDLPFL